MTTESANVKQNLVHQIKNLPEGNDFYAALSFWEWSYVDNVALPCVLRDNEKFVPVHVVELCLLSKFPPNPPEIHQNPMVSYKMSVMEAWTINTINCLERKFEFGYRLFTPNDEIVKLTDVENYYNSLKMFHLAPVHTAMAGASNDETVYLFGD